MSGLPGGDGKGGVTAGLDALLKSPRLRRVRLVAVEDGHEVLGIGLGELRLRVRVPNLCGGLVPFDLLVTVDGHGLEVREDPASPNQRLPQGCPDRHIVFDGSFCLHWDGANRFDFDTDAGCRGWLDALVSFLLRQVEAELTRCWPAEAGWAHGGGAVHQMQAEEAAEAVHPRFAEAVRRRRLTVEPKRRVLLLDGVRVVAGVKGGKAGTVGQGTVTGLRRPCPCGAVDKRERAVSRRNCGTHAQKLAEVIEHLAAMQAAEERYVAMWRRAGRTCCGTLERCSVRDAECGGGKGAP